MVVTPPDVVSHHLNHTGQNILTIASWVLTAGVLGLAAWLSRRARNPIYLCLVVASGVAALAEPLYDVMFNLYFYSGHGMAKTYTVFDIPQPVWAYSGYVILYGLPAMFVVKEIHEGRMTRNRLWMWAGVELLESCVFEIAGINLGTYTYWGPHVFRIWHYPIVIGVLEAAQVMTFAVACANLHHRMTEAWQGLGAFVIFPCTMLGANFGAGAAVIIAINAQDTSVGWVRFGTVVSIVTAALLVRLAIGLIPPPGRAGDAARTEPARRPLAAPVLR
ncbi:MAG TPA: hypothetical protein VHV82_17895 [Sporichthyaceae bacterium]|jgi:hypothetical protein|nr:hypothetical protein [Sporichthyaceae bacterium]